MSIKLAVPDSLLATWRKLTKSTSKDPGSLGDVKVTMASSDEAKSHKTQRMGILEHIGKWMSGWNLSLKFSFPWSSKKSADYQEVAVSAEDMEVNGTEVNTEQIPVLTGQEKLKQALKKDKQAYESIVDEDSEYSNDQERLEDLSQLADKLLLRVKEFNRLMTEENSSSIEIKQYLSQARQCLNQVKEQGTGNTIGEVSNATQRAMLHMKNALEKMESPVLHSSTGHIDAEQDHADESSSITGLCDPC